MRIHPFLFVTLLPVSLAACGGSSPAAPSTETPTTPASTSLVISSVSPNPATATSSLDGLQLTVTGANFVQGLTLTITPPIGLPIVPSGPQIPVVSPTSFTVNRVLLTGGGAHTLQVTNPDGSKSNVFSMNVTALGPTFTPEGTHLTEVTAGFPGAGISDSSTIRLNDGRWRTYFTGDHRIRSAISTNGLSMTMEPGIRIDTSPISQTALAASVRMLRLDDGRMRAYFSALGNMYSAISSDDGTTFTVESGIRVLSSVIGDTSIHGGDIVRTRDGRWRMYTSGGFSAKKIFSFTSTDLLNWTLESGVRIGDGSAITAGAEHPSAYVNPDGSTSVFYYCALCGRPTGIYVATSADGLTFTQVFPVGINTGGDPDVVDAGGFVRMYYNWGNEVNGTISSARLVGNLSAPASAAMSSLTSFFSRR